MAFIFTNLNSPYPEMLCAKCGYYWPSGLGVFSLYCFYLDSLEKGVALHLNKLEFPLTKDALCKVWLTLGR